MYLCLDIGHTAIKWRLNDGAICCADIDDFLPANLPSLAENSAVLISAVAQTDLLLLIKQYYKNHPIFIAKTQKQYKQLINAYEDVSQLGVDRWLALVATYEDYPRQNTLVLSFGTATTLDVLNQCGNHKGGLIMPSLVLIKQGFMQFNQSPHPVVLTPDIQLSNNTQQAWQFGCEALWFAGVYKTIHQVYKNCQIEQLVITGGYAKMVMTRLHLHYQYRPDLVLRGLSFVWDNEN